MTSPLGSQTIQSYTLGYHDIENSSNDTKEISLIKQVGSTILHGIKKVQEGCIFVAIRINPNVNSLCLFLFQKIIGMNSNPGKNEPPVEIEMQKINSEDDQKPNLIVSNTDIFDSIFEEGENNLYSVMSNMPDDR